MNTNTGSNRIEKRRQCIRLIRSAIRDTYNPRAKLYLMIAFIEALTMNLKLAIDFLGIAERIEACDGR